MITKSKIFLVGMPGSGKSTLGKDLAAQLELHFVDLDDEIEKVNGNTVREIFARRGEEAFRKLEQNEFERSIGKLSSFVMATGGGTPCFFDNLAIMKSSGLVMFLNISPKILAKRLLAGKGIEKRPLLKGLNENSIEGELSAKLEKRLPYYSQAQVTLTENNATVIEVQRIIEEYYKLSK